MRNFVIGTQIVTEEVAAAFRRLKCRKAPSPDGIQSEHLKYGGEMIAHNSVVNPSRSWDAGSAGHVYHQAVKPQSLKTSPEHAKHSLPMEVSAHTLAMESLTLKLWSRQFTTCPGHPLSLNNSTVW